MAKSKNGGTRSYIRGRIGSDVYSIGKDAKGNKQQVVRALAESVANPQTTAQMRGRMIMSTVMQAVSAMSHIIDHSFDVVPQGQPSISEFIRRNYQLIKADVAAHPSTGNSFGLNEYKEKGIKVGAYNVSAGSAVMPTGITALSQSQQPKLKISASTFADLVAKWGLGSEGYITLLRVVPGELQYARVRCIADAAAETAISSDNVASLFDVEANTDVKINYEAESGVSIELDLGTVEAAASGYIVSEKTVNGYVHSDCTLKPFSASPAADVALPTYPVGEERFLNGGEL